MSMLRHILLALSLSLLLTFQPTSAEKPDLVIEVFRHGARGPLNQTFDPAQDWSDSVEQLTPAGMRMHYLLGAAMKDRYPHLLESYDPDEIYVRSTDVNRTIMSAYSHMYGIYGESGPELGNVPVGTAIPPFESPLIQEMAKELGSEYALPNNLQVVPVHVVTASQDNILASYVACPKAESWVQENSEGQEATKIFVNELNEVTSYLQSKGLQVETFKDLFYAADNAIANRVEQKELPGRVDPNSQYFKDLKFAFEWFSSNTVAGSEQQVTLYPLDLLHAIAGYMNGTINGKSKLKFAFLSAHDTTLITLLSAFDITTTDCLLANYKSQKLNKETPYPQCKYPQFASNILFEFYNTSQPYIKLFYDGVPVPFCGNKDNTCTYEQFLPYMHKVTKNRTSNDYRDVCEFSESVLTAKVHKLQILVVTLIVLCLISLGGLVFVIVKHNYQKLKKEGNVKWIPLENDKEQEKSTTKIELSNQHALRT